MRPSATLLLTSTIQPKPPFDKIERAEPSVRYNDYSLSLLKWITHRSRHIDGIVYCDNSGYDLSELKCLIGNASANIPIEFISYIEPVPPLGVHYGYSELKLVRHALQQSQLLKQAQYFIKSTGRLYFKDIDVLFSSIPLDFKAIVDCRGIHAHEIGLPIRVRTQLMIFERLFYLRSVDRLLDDMPSRRDSHIEEFMAYCLLRASCKYDSDHILFRFPVNCQPSGISGNGYNYNSSRARIKGIALAALRKYFPSLYA